MSKDVPIEQIVPTVPPVPAVLHNSALPLANTDLLAAAITPRNTPTTFRIQVAMSIIGIFNATITRGGVTVTVSFNSAVNLVANALYIFDFLVHDGDSVNFQYTTTGGTILILRLQEVAASAA